MWRAMHFIFKKNFIWEQMCIRARPADLIPKFVNWISVGSHVVQNAVMWYRMCGLFWCVDCDLHFLLSECSSYNKN